MWQKIRGGRTFSLMDTHTHAHLNDHDHGYATLPESTLHLYRLRNQVQELHNLLDRQRQEFFDEKNQLSQESEDTKQQLVKQISLKKIHIKREKKTKRELERVKKYADPKTLNACNMAVQVNETKGRKERKKRKSSNKMPWRIRLLSRHRWRS
ncbi:hypothetical protein ABVT39_017460 [Epinephelus coioides]